MKNKKIGFTIVELLIAMVILVIVFGLVTYLYTRAARIRKIVVINSEVQQVLSQISDTLTYGNRENWGIIHATEVADDSQENILHLYRDTQEMHIIIDDVDGEWGSLYIYPKLALDPGNKIFLNNSATVNKTIPLSYFEYYNTQGELLDPSVDNISTTSYIKIVLWAKSTDPTFKNAPPVPFITGVRLRNKPSS